MSGVVVNYNNNALTSMSSSGTKTLLTSGKYCEGNFEVVYSAPALSSLTVTPTETAQTFNATGVYGYKPVMVNGISSTYVGTGIATRSAANLTASGSVVTVPAGYYSSQVTKSVASATLATPAITLASATGVVTATENQTTAGYIAATSKTSTYTLTTQAAQTLYPSTATQYINSYRWLTGSQTIASVTTSNLTAENIAEGVVVKVGDANNASRITQITGTHSGGGKHKIKITQAGADGGSRVVYNNISYYELNEEFYVTDGDTITIVCAQGFSNNRIYVDGELIVSKTDGSIASYNLVVSSDINVKLGSDYGSTGSAYVYEYVVPSGTSTITANGTYNVYGYASANVSLPTQAAQIFYVSTADRTISSGVYLTGAQTIMSVTTSNLTASNIASGVTVKIGDANMAGRISQVTGTYMPSYYYIYRNLAEKSAVSHGTTDFDTYIGNLTTLKSYMFAGYPISYSTEAYVFSKATTIHDYCFAGTEIGTTSSGCIFNFPSVSYIYGNAFYQNHRLLQIEASKCWDIYSSAFYRCKNLQSCYFPSVSSIHNAAFRYCSSLQSAIFESCKFIDYYAFADCSSLSLADFSLCSVISNYAFYYCGKLKTISFPACKVIGQFAFYCCYSLMSAYFPSCTAVEGSAFFGCSSLSIADFPMCQSTSTAAFSLCSTLTSINFPVCSSTGQYTFCYCTALVSAYLPSCTTLGMYTFASCSNLSVVSIPICATISDRAFQYCTNLISLYLDQVSSVPTIGGNTFYSTPISTYSTVAGRYGSVFVPSSLYNDFITNNSWKYFSSRIVSV